MGKNRQEPVLSGKKKKARKGQGKSKQSSHKVVLIDGTSTGCYFSGQPPSRSWFEHLLSVLRSPVDDVSNVFTEFEASKGYGSWIGG